MIAVSLADIQAEAATRGQGYLEAVLAAAVKDEETPGVIYVPPSDYQRIAAEFSPPPAANQIRSAVLAVRKWAASGMPVCTPREIADRYATCKGCKYHRPGKSLLLSSCGKCGCKGMKLYLETERCPVGKW